MRCSRASGWRRFAAILSGCLLLLTLLRLVAVSAEPESRDTAASNPSTPPDSDHTASRSSIAETGPADHREHVATVTGVEDVHALLSAAEFWPRVLAHALPAVRPVDDLWSSPILRYYFFGGGALAPNLGRASLAIEHETLWPAGKGLLGKTADPAHYFTIATDVHLDPVLMPREGLSDRYYPRREGDWLLEFYLPSFVYGADETGELLPDTVASFRERSRQLADFLLYEQYDADVGNSFCHDNYLDDYPDILSHARDGRWQYGFDDLFDTDWTDPSGYRWTAHEPDFGVNAGSEALALVRSWETLKNDRYLDAARSFLLHQVPRHGFHTGLWRGRRYYWLSATPEVNGRGEDPVNSVEAEVAAPLAAVGYYTHDRAMLELARGLLSYLAREWSTTGRWYYEGQENDAIQRSHPVLSQEAETGSHVAESLPYLLAAGVDVKPEVDLITPAIHFLITHQPDSYPVVPSETRYVRSYLAFSPTRGLRPGGTLLLRTFVQVTGGGASSMTLEEKLPDAAVRPATLEVTIRHGGETSMASVPVAPDGAFSIPIGSAPFRPWDRYSLDANVTLGAKFTVDEFPMDRPIVHVDPGAGQPPLDAVGDVQDYHYQVKLNALNFLEAPGWLYFPHRDLQVK